MCSLSCLKTSTLFWKFNKIYLWIILIPLQSNYLYTTVSYQFKSHCISGAQKQQSKFNYLFYFHFPFYTRFLSAFSHSISSSFLIPPSLPDIVLTPTFIPPSLHTLTHTHSMLLSAVILLSSGLCSGTCSRVLECNGEGVAEEWQGYVATLQTYIWQNMIQKDVVVFTSIKSGWRVMINPFKNENQKTRDWRYTCIRVYICTKQCLPISFLTFSPTTYLTSRLLTSYGPFHRSRGLAIFSMQTTAKESRPC